MKESEANTSRSDGRNGPQIVEEESDDKKARDSEGEQLEQDPAWSHLQKQAIYRRENGIKTRFIVSKFKNFSLRYNVGRDNVLCP